MSGHAIFSPSRASRFMACIGSVAMEQGEPDTSSAYADEGTAAHFLGSECLTHDTHPVTFIGKRIRVTPTGAEWDTDPGKYCNIFIVDADMAAHVNTYVQTVKEYAQGGQLLVERRLPIGHITGEDGAEGTGDAIILRDDEIIVIDLKYGRGVEVSAVENPQLKMYGLGAIEAYSMLGDFKRVRLVISQPRVQSAPSEWDVSVEDLAAFAVEVRQACNDARIALEFKSNWISQPGTSGYLTPSDDACKFCKAKASCPALRNMVLSSVADDFVVIDEPLAPQLSGAQERVSNCDDAHLDSLFPVLGLIEEFVSAVRAKIEARALSGVTFGNCKLVQGKRGNRQWGNAEEAEQMLKSMRLKVEEMYDLKLISPTSAEKLTKAADESGKPIIGPRQWPKLAAMVVQKDGSPTIAPIGDKRPALEIKPIADEFAPIAEDELV